MSVFGQQYASVYDDVYATKDYDRECEIVERFFLEFGRGPMKRIADLGCGTGNHAVRLASQGYSVQGVDISEAMLEVAREKAQALNFDVCFEKSSLQNLSFTRLAQEARAGQPFDAALLMSTILGYVASNEDIVRVLQSVRAILRQGALLIADIWYGPAVLAQGPSTKFREIQGQDRTVLRIAEGEIDLIREIYETTISLWTLSNSQLVGQSRERHEIRFFFPRELELFLSSTGFALSGLFGFPEIDMKPSSRTWPVIFVASAC